MKNTISLALIEDDVDIQELVLAFFRPRGYVVTVYSDANELLQSLRQQKNCSFDVIITDLHLPTLSGIEFIHEVKSLGINTPIIMMTIQSNAEIAVRAIQAGAYDYIVKPIHFPQLQISVERALYLNQIKSENLILKTVVAVKEGSNLDGIVGRSPSFQKVIELVKRVAPSNSSVLLSGETGTGKEVIAKAIHSYSLRAKKKFVAINCSAIPENLLESELFGHAKGAFTGACEKKIGLFEEAEGGTLFLDEIGDLSLPLQSKILRVLQERQIKRIGENQTRAANVRIISATHKNLRQEVANGRFREDLFFRLNVIPIFLPPLRDRKEDIVLLANFFLKKFALLSEKNVISFSKDALEYLIKNSWRGNVRELENTVERAVVLSTGETIEKIDMEFENNSFAEQTHKEDGNSHSECIETLEAITKRHILFALKRNNGAKDKTARDLGINRKTLYRKIISLEGSDRLVH